MAIFGLSHTIDTKVGNDYVRGVSGGERKRVSIAEIALSGSPLQCWDNSTRGLDSATALEFVRTLRMNTDLVGSTCALAIYQAPQAAYDIFDKVILLYEGRQIYFGRTAEALKYFTTDMGFICPPRSTTADFLTSLTNPAERVVAPGFENKVPRTPEEFAARWQASPDRQRLLAEIDAFEKEFPFDGGRIDEFRNFRSNQQAKGTNPKSPYTISIPMQVKLCAKRGFKRLRGDYSVTISGIIANTIMALVIGSVFYNLPMDTSSFFSRGALLFFAILLNAFASVSEMLTLYAQRPIVEKHARYAFYHPFAEAIASMIVDMPAKVTAAIAFNLALYFMTNLRREVGPFFIFVLFSFTCTLVMSNIFRTIASVSKTIHTAMPFAAIFIMGLIMYTGFAIPTRDMRAYSRWLNYVNPISYAFDALMSNEFAGQRYPCASYVPSSYGGVLPEYDLPSGSLSRVCNTAGSFPGIDYVDGTVYINTAYEYTRDHMWRNFGILIVYFVIFLFAHLFATEYISAAKSKGEVLVFRRGKVPNLGGSDIEGTSEKRAVVNCETLSNDTNEISSIIQKQTAIFHWNDVVYDIKIKGEDRRLLDHVDGWVKPGTLTALMGVSGAGKTTLLDVLANRVTMGIVTGDMFVDGRQRDESFQRKTGYVQQQDLHLGTTTVREALQFSVLLRQPASVPHAEKIAYADEIIDLLEMRSYADAVVGVPGEGLNVEQRKRLVRLLYDLMCVTAALTWPQTIGVELSAKPELLLFLDEPTSGLDSQTAWSICTLLRKLTNSGQAILCTIHQPSSLLMEEFDRLLFLARGGKTVYFGPIGKNSEVLTSYFERNGSHPCPSGANPAEWMLEVIGAAPGASTDKDWPVIWDNSPEKVAVKAELAQMQTELSVKPRSVDAHGDLEFAVPFRQQLAVCTKRVFEQYWRTPTYIWSKALLCTANALAVGFTFFMASNSLRGLQNQMFAIFMLLPIYGTLSLQMMPHFVIQRSLYEVRERPSKAYSWKAFMMANITVEIPWQTLMAVITFVSWYYPIGLYRNTEVTDSLHERGILMFLFIWAFYMWMCTFSHMLVAGIESAETAGNIGQLCFSLCLVFCGILASPDVFPRFWIFVYRVSPFTYLVSGMISTAVANSDVVCSSIEILRFQPTNGQACGEFMANYTMIAGGRTLNPTATDNCEFCPLADTNAFLTAISSEYANRWRDFGLLMVYLIFNIVGALFLYWLARVPKNTFKSKKKE